MALEKQLDEEERQHQDRRPEPVDAFDKSTKMKTVSNGFRFFIIVP